MIFRVLFREQLSFKNAKANYISSYFEAKLSRAAGRQLHFFGYIKCFRLCIHLLSPDGCIEHIPRLFVPFWKTFSFCCTLDLSQIKRKKKLLWPCSTLNPWHFSRRNFWSSVCPSRSFKIFCLNRWEATRSVSTFSQRERKRCIFTELKPGRGVFWVTCRALCDMEPTTHPCFRRMQSAQKFPENWWTQMHGIDKLQDRARQSYCLRREPHGILISIQ